MCASTKKRLMVIMDECGKFAGVGRGKRWPCLDESLGVAAGAESGVSKSETCHM